MGKRQKEGKMYKILLVEDDKDWFKNWSDLLKKIDQFITVMWKPTIEEAETEFSANKDSFDLIIMDACVPGNSPNTMSLVRRIVESGFKKPIIACSSAKPYLKLLIDAGATHTISKMDIYKSKAKITQLLRQ
jgi:response regulator of citrate/malate metabolism